MTTASVKVQIVPESVPSTPSWLAEVTIVAHVFTQFELLQAIQQQVRFARARLGIYDVIDFAVVLLGYAVSSERTLEDFYERLKPLGKVFMALFGRDRLPSHAALSRFLAALDKPAVEALRTLFQQDLVARPSPGPGGLRDREGQHWLVMDVDATKEAARQRALPHGPDLPAPHRRMDLVCAPGYAGRKRGEVVRSRTTVLQAHTRNWIGTFGGAGNGDYRGELLRAVEAITGYAQARSLPLSRILIRLDGLYGDAAPLIDILMAGLGVVVRGKDYSLLDLPSVQARLALPPDEQVTHPESGVSRDLFDCLQVPLTQAGPMVRMIVATRPATATTASIGTTRNGLVYEIFLTTASPQAFTPSDVLHLYLHRGSFETALADEDQEQDPDRWVSHTPCGQEFWQILSQWICNIRIELGHHLSPTPMRLTELVPTGVVTSPASVAPIQMIAPVAIEGPIRSAESAARGGQTLRESPTGYGPPKFSDASSCAGFPGSAFAVQPDGTLLCPAQQPLYPQERRVQPNGSLRIVYAARIGHCRACPLRSQCQGSRRSSRGPRRVSAVCQPLLASSLTATESKSVQFDSSSVVMEAAPALLEPASAPIESRSMELDGSSAVMETAPALPELSSPSTSPDEPTQRGESALRGGLAQATLSVEYGPPKFSNTSSCAGFAGSAFAVQPDGTLLCPAQQPLYPQERRLLPNGSLRIVYAARIGHCRACPLRSQCQGSRRSSRGPRRVSAVCQPLLASPPAAAESRSVQVERSSAVMESVPALLEPASAAAESRSVQTDSSSAVVESAPTLPEPAFAAVQAKSVPIDSSSAVVESAPTLLSPLSPAPISPVLWQDWPASQIRRRWLKLLRRETALLTIGPVPTEEVQTDDPEQKVLTRAQRAHWRLSWSERLARNARGASAPALSITLHGLPVSFARAFALDIAA